MTVDQPEQGSREHESGPDDLDFWSFIELAQRRLSEEVGPEYLLATQVLLTLNRAANVVTYDLESAVHRPHGLSWSAFRLMFVVWLAGPVEPKTAARLTGMSRAAVSNLTKTLESADLLRRRPDEHDGRSVQLSLTDHGRVTIEQVFTEHNEREFAWAGALTEAEQRILILLLDKLITNRRQFDVRGRN